MATATHPGRLALIDGASLIEFSDLPEVKALNPAKADMYAAMSEGRAVRYAPEGYETGADGFNEDMVVALHILGEQIVVRQESVARRVEALGMKAESQGLHKYERLESRVEQLIPFASSEIFDFYANVNQVHGVTTSKIFASPHMTDASANSGRLTIREEEVFEPYVDLDVNRKMSESLSRS